ncbi:MAG TPA: hypothetical protein VN045_04345, partial [Microbacteriaceae bacterium]|nr:hypothetical protein [Microbacteriaceae bacterium]
MSVPVCWGAGSGWLAAAAEFAGNSGKSDAAGQTPASSRAPKPAVGAFFLSYRYARPVQLTCAQLSNQTPTRSKGAATSATCWPSRQFNWRNSQKRALITTNHRHPIQKRAGHPGSTTGRRNTGQIRDTKDNRPESPGHATASDGAPRRISCICAGARVLAFAPKN